jgi:tRNA nucleotidyltransferase (CCA-adding enzyme)
MKCTEISSSIQKKLDHVMDDYPLVRTIVDAVHAQGGRTLLVGGAVRDLMLGLDVKDLDIEVHGLTMDQLEQVLRKHGPVSLVGKSFGVLHVHGLDVDWSIPRTDSAGRKPQVELDPFMNIENAFRRRDLTINAMGIDLVTHELIDPFGGEQDLRDRILRPPDEHLFIEDPLRFFRVMQFIGRFNMWPTAELNAICMAMDITQVSVERIETEFEKLLLKSERPSRGIRWLHHITRLHEILPELAATSGVPQEKKWHPEGDVFEHLMQAVDAAAMITCPDATTQLILMYAALCHDLGKATTTRQIDGVWRSLEHAQAGAQLAKRLLARITNHQQLIEAVCKLVRYHLEPMQFIESGARPAAYKRLAAKLASQTTIRLLADLALADQRGRNGSGHEPLRIDVPEIDQFRERAQAAAVFHHIEKPILMGRDIINEVEPGVEMGKLLHQAYQMQLEEEITDKEALKRRVLGHKK